MVRRATQVDARRPSTAVLGPLELERAYYHCPACGHGFFPRDQRLGLQDTSLSPAVTRMIGTVGAMVSFEEGRQLLEELAGVAVDAKQVERAAEALGAEIAADEIQDLEPMQNPPLPSTLYLGMDGTGIPMRASELKGRSGKQPDGSAKTREVKLCTVWSADSRDSERRPVRDEGSVTYSAAIESAATLDTDEVPSAFTQRVLREATRRCFTQAQCTVVIGDGACLDLEDRSRTVSTRHSNRGPLPCQRTPQQRRQVPLRRHLRRGQALGSAAARRTR